MIYRMKIFLNFLFTISCFSLLCAEKPDIEIFDFSYISYSRKGILVKTHNSPVQGTLKLFFDTWNPWKDCRNSGKSLKNFVWSEKINLPKNMEKIFLIPGKEYRLTRNDDISLELHTQSGKIYQYETIKGLYGFVVLNSSTAKNLTEKFNTENDTNAFSNSVNIIPENYQDFFFPKLILGLQELNQLNEKQYEALKLFLANYGKVILIDNIKTTPGKRATELLGLEFGSKTKSIPTDILEALTASFINSPSNMPKLREFTITSENISSPRKFPFYFTSYGLGYISYIPYNISKPEFLKQIKDKTFKNLFHYIPTTENVFNWDRLLNRSKRDRIKPENYLNKIGKNINNNPLMKIVFVALFIYILAHAFLLFLLFQKEINRQQWLKACLLTAILFIVIPIFITSISGFDKVECRYSESQEHSYNGNYCITQGMLTFSSPYCNSFNIDWSKKPSYILNTNFNITGDQYSFSFQKPENLKITLNSYDSTRIAFCDINKSKNPFAATLTVNANHKTVSGNIVNQSEYDFSGGLAKIPVGHLYDKCKNHHRNYYQVFIEIPPIKSKQKIKLTNTKLKQETAFPNYAGYSKFLGPSHLLADFSRNLIMLSSSTTKSEYLPAFKNVKTSPVEKNFLFYSLPVSVEFTGNYSCNVNISQDFQPPKQANLNQGAKDKDGKPFFPEKPDVKTDNDPWSWGYFGNEEKTQLKNSSVILKQSSSTFLPKNVSKIDFSIFYETRTYLDESSTADRSSNGILSAHLLNWQTGKWEVIKTVELETNLNKYREKLRKELSEIIVEKSKVVSQTAPTKKDKKQNLKKAFPHHGFWQKPEKQKKHPPKDYKELKFSVGSPKKYFLTKTNNLYIKISHRDPKSRVIIKNAELILNWKKEK